MTHSKMTRKLIPFLFILPVFLSCNSKPKESEFTKAAREVFFNAAFSVKYEDALAFYKANSSLVDVKMFDSASSRPDLMHQFIFQKHPVIKQGLKAGSIYVLKGASDSAGFRQVMYFLTKEDALRASQAIDVKLRKSAKQVSTTDSANRKTTIYAAEKTDAISGVMANLVTDDSNDMSSVLTLNLIKNRN